MTPNSITMKTNNEDIFKQLDRLCPIDSNGIIDISIIYTYNGNIDFWGEVTFDRGIAYHKFGHNRFRSGLKDVFGISWKTFISWALKRSNFKGYAILYAGNVITFKHTMMHSFDDKPAVIDPTGKKVWYFNGMLHREDDKPALTCDINGTEMWYKYGKPHREGDKPAEIILENYETVLIRYFKNGKCHRDSKLGPAMIRKNAIRYIENGWYNRDPADGPAEIRYNSVGNIISEKYYRHGALLSGNEINKPTI